MVGEKETIDISVGLWMGKERGRRGGRRGAHVHMKKRLLNIFRET